MFEEKNRGGRPVTEEERELKEQARALGLEFHPRVGAQKLRQLIAEKTGRMPQEGMPEGVTAAPKGKLFYTEKEWERKELGEKKRESGRLVRVRITCMNPNKKNWTGEIISVGSSKVGTFKKFIPFNMEEPYHIPYIIYKELKNRKCAIRSVTKLPNGQEQTKTKLINEFSIDVLPPLTKAELEDLKQRQAMAHGTAA